VLPVETTYTFNIDAATFGTLGGHHFDLSETNDGTNGAGVSFTSGVTSGGANTGTMVRNLTLREKERLHLVGEMQKRLPSKPRAIQPES
jgi:hypothetical protein